METQLLHNSSNRTRHYYKLGLACNRTRTIPSSDEASKKILTGYLQMLKQIPGLKWAPKKG